MDEILFQNEPDFISLSNFIAKIMSSNQNFQYLNQDDEIQLHSLIDRAITKIQSVCNPSSQFTDNYIPNIEDDSEQVSAISIFSLISQSLYILMQQINLNQSSGSNDELIISFHARNEELEKENSYLKTRMSELSGINSNEFIEEETSKIQNQNIDDTDDNTEELIKFNETEQENEPKELSDPNSTIISRICNKLHLESKASNEDELVKIINKQLNKPKKIKKELIRHYKLNLNIKSEVPLSKIIENLDKRINKDAASHNDLKRELTEATESLNQLKKELENITRSYGKKDQKIRKLRAERNEANEQLSELLETIKESNYNASLFIPTPESKKCDQKGIEFEALENSLQRAQNSLRKKKQKIERLKKKIQSLEEKELQNSNSANSADFDPKNKSYSISAELFDSAPIEKVGSSIETKKELIELKSLLSKKDEKIACLNKFMNEIAASCESTANELAEESKNKCELAKCVQHLLCTNKILESLLETSNQQKDELKQQLDSSLFRVQNNNEDDSQDLDDETSQNVIHQMRQLTDDIFHHEGENETIYKVLKFSKDKSLLQENYSDVILEIYKFSLECILCQEKKLNEVNNELINEKNFTSNLYKACLGQLRFILDFSNSKMIQKWVFGDDNEEWIRQAIQIQAARMEDFFDNYTDSYEEKNGELNEKLPSNPLQRIEKGVFDELLPISKNSTDENQERDSAIPLSTRIGEFLANYKKNLVYNKMTAENKDLYLMLVQCIAANNVLQLFSTEIGNRCKSQFFEIRNLKSLLSQNKYPDTPPTETETKTSKDTDVDEPKSDEKKKKKKNINERNASVNMVYEEMNNIINILRKAVSKILSKDESSNHPDLFICLKCIERGEKLDLNRDKYVRKLEKNLAKLNEIIKDSNGQLELAKKEKLLVESEIKSKLSEKDEAINKLTKQLSNREKELKTLKEAISMLNFGGGIKEEIAPKTDNFAEEEEEDIKQNIEKIEADLREHYEEVVNLLKGEVDQLEQKVTKMTENSKSEIEALKDKAKKKQSKLLTTISFLTSQKKEIEEEQAKERELNQKTIEQNQTESTRLKQQIDDLNATVTNLNDKVTKIQVENKLLKSKLKNEEEKSDRERSLFESRLKLKSFSIENSMKEKIEEARKQQEGKLDELVLFIFNLFNDEVDLLIKNENEEVGAPLLRKDTENSVYSFLQSIKSKMSSLERSSFASNSAINELNEIRSIIENYQGMSNPIVKNGKCSKILKEIFNELSQKAEEIVRKENELKKLKIDSSSRVLEKAGEAVAWENWSRRIQRVITGGFESFSSRSISEALFSVQRPNNGGLMAKAANPKEMRNKLEEAIFALLKGDTQRILKKIEILRAEKNFFLAYRSNEVVGKCIAGGRSELLDDDDGRGMRADLRHLIIVSIFMKRIEKLSGNVETFFVARRRNPDVSEFVEEAQDLINCSPTVRSSKPIFSQFVSPM